MDEDLKSVISSKIEFLDIFENMQEKLNIFELIYNEKGEIVDLKIKYLNNPIEFANRPLEQLIGRKISEILGFENISSYLKIAREIAPEKRHITFEHYYAPTDKYFITSAFSTQNSYYITLSMDITKEKKSRGELKSSQQILGNILENFPGVVFWKDINSTYLGCNKNFAKAAGLENPLDIVGKNDYQLPWADTEAEAYRADDRQVMDNGEPKLNIVETQYQFRGRIAWFDTSKIPLFDHKGIVIGILGVSNDITELKRTEEELIQARDH